MLLSNQPFVYLEERHGISKQGKPWQFIVLANPKTFENYELFAEGVPVSDFEKKRDLVNIEVDLSAGFGKTHMKIVSMTLAN